MKLGLFILCLVCAIPVPVDAGAQNGTLKSIVTVFTGAAAAHSALNTDAAEALYREKESILDKLKAQGIDPKTSTLYSTYFQLNRSAIKWQRFIGWPNVILEVEITGKGSFLVPKIDTNYQGISIHDTLIGEYAPPGTEVIVNVYDDKQAKTMVWNAIRQISTIHLDFDKIMAPQLLRIVVQPDGALRVLENGATISKPVRIATAAFRVPESTDGRWLSDATFLDNDGNHVGRLQFQQLWTYSDPANPTVAALQARSQYISWIAITGIIAGMFFVLLWLKNKTRKHP